MNSKYKAALLGVPLVVSTALCLISLVALGEIALLEGPRVRYLAVLAGMLLSLVVSVACLKAIMGLDRPSGVKAGIALRYLDLKETLKILFLWACASVCGMIVFGFFVSDTGLAGLSAFIIAPFVWFRSIQALKCRAFFIHPDDRRRPAAQ